jgi:hypothetical protein
LLGNQSHNKSRDGLTDEALEEEDESNADSNVSERLRTDTAWLLGGSGRWKIDKQGLSSHGNTTNNTTNVTIPVTSQTANKDKLDPNMKNINLPVKAVTNKKITPAAQMSMTSPKISVDSASEAVSIFSLKMIEESSWYFHESFSPVTNMIVNQTESLLIGGSKSGMIKIYSLNSHPVCKVGIYNVHSSPIVSTSFTRNGAHVASCDGSIYVWDIETSKTLARHVRFDQLKYTHSSAVSPRNGILSDIGVHGDDQIVACAGCTLAHFDFRVSTMHSLRPLSEWMLQQPTISNFNNSTVSNNEQCVLSCTASHELYTCVGSLTGMIWILDRRTGRTLFCCQAHDGPIIKVLYTTTTIH